MACRRDYVVPAATGIADRLATAPLAVVAACPLQRLDPLGLAEWRGEKALGIAGARQGLL